VMGRARGVVPFFRPYPLSPRTRAVFDHYNIVNENDLAEAMKRVGEYHLAHGRKLLQISNKDAATG
jgi:hypothetical protein